MQTFHFTLQTASCTLHTSYCIPNTAYCTPNPVSCPLYNAQHTLPTTHITACTVSQTMKEMQQKHCIALLCPSWVKGRAMQCIAIKTIPYMGDQCVKNIFVPEKLISEYIHASKSNKYICSNEYFCL